MQREATFGGTGLLITFLFVFAYAICAIGLVIFAPLYWGFGIAFNDAMVAAEFGGVFGGILLLGLGSVASMAS